MKLTKKKEKLVKYQEEKNLFAFERDGTTFVYVSKKQIDQRSIGAGVSQEGGAGSYATERERDMYDCIVFPSGSTRPIPYENWLEQARQFLPTASAGEALPEQLNGLSFSVPAGAVTIGIAGATLGATTVAATEAAATATFRVWKQVVKPSLDYVVRRIREGFELYQQEYEVPDVNEPEIPDVVGLQLVTFLANTPQGGDYYPVYHPLSEQDVMEALRQMERDGEIRIEGSEVHFLS